MALADSAIAGYAQAAGLSGQNVAIAVAIAIAESGGNPNAHNAVPPDDSYGLWQINMLGSLGPQRRSALGISSNTQLYDPSINARAMAMISSGGSNWKPWTTYTRGTYQLFMSRGQAAAGNPSAAPGGAAGLPGATPVGLGVSLTSVNKAIDYLTDPATYIRASMLIGGVAFLLFGLSKMVGADPVKLAKLAVLKKA